MLNHRNIIKLHSMHIHSNQCILLMEYAAGGELWQYVKESENGLDEVECRALIK